MTTTDRGAIIHFAGFHHLSPALDGKGMPAFSEEASPELKRCGWATFFEAAGSRGLAMSYALEDGASARFVAGREAHDEGAPTHGLGEAIAHSRRFLANLFPEKPAGS